MDELNTRVKKNLENEEARYAYADTITNAFVAAQIKALRDARDLSQEELAELIGTKQSGVSRLERADYSSWKVETLRKLARAFHVRLRIRFEGFGTLLDEVGGFNEKNLLPPRFEDDPTFKEQAEEQIAAAIAQTDKIAGDDLSLLGNSQDVANKAVVAHYEQWYNAVARMVGSSTENIAICAAGLGSGGNLIETEFVRSATGTTIRRVGQGIGAVSEQAKNQDGNLGASAYWSPTPQHKAVGRATSTQNQQLGIGA